MSEEVDGRKSKKNEGGSRNKTRRGRVTNGVLVGTLIVLVALMVGLVVGLAVTREKESGEVGEGTMQEEETAENGEVDGTESGDETMVSDDEEVDAKIAEVQEKIEATDNPDELVQYYEERIFFILDRDTTDQYAQQVIDDTIAVDNIEQSLNSAAQVINVAEMYDRNDLVAEYNSIIEERATAEGVDLHGGGMG